MADAVRSRAFALQSMAAGLEGVAVVGMGVVCPPTKTQPPAPASPLVTLGCEDGELRLRGHTLPGGRRAYVVEGQDLSVLLKVAGC